jgi:putative endonuclease
VTRVRAVARASGQRAEAAVADYLSVQGFVILATNLRLGHLELDVVAQRGELVVVVEVRTRGKGAFEGALASVTLSKRRHLLLATHRLWQGTLQRNPRVERVRIDVAAVHFEGAQTRVEYFPGAVVD